MDKTHPNGKAIVVMSLGSNISGVGDISKTINTSQKNANA